MTEDLKPCQCYNEGARTLKKIFDGLWKCPRCGGLVVTRQPTGLVSLSESDLDNFLLNFNTVEGENFIGYSKLRLELRNKLMETFGQPSVVDVESLLNNDSSVLTINILRKWPREKIESFAKHLLGENYPSVVLPEKKKEDTVKAYQEFGGDLLRTDFVLGKEWNACLDAIKELNPGLTYED